MSTSRRQTVYIGAARESILPERVFIFMPAPVLGRLAMGGQMPRLQCLAFRQFPNVITTHTRRLAFGPFPNVITTQRGARPVLAAGTLTNSQFRANWIII